MNQMFTPNNSHSNGMDSSSKISQNPLMSWVTFQERVFKRYKRRPARTAARNTSGIGLHLRTSPLKKLTKHIKETYRNANKDFYFQEVVPKRVLTQPCELDPKTECDNLEGNLVCFVNDILESPSIQYVILDLLGQGTFGQVFRCQDPMTKNMVGVKVIKNRPAFHNQAKLEIQILCYLREKVDPHNKKHLVRLLDYFHFKNHICMVFELLSINLYELLKQNKFRGLPLPIIQHFIKQMTESLAALEAANIMHCDLKPENILLVAKDRDRSGNSAQDSQDDMEPSNKKRGKSINEVKLIDFGSACFEGKPMYTYIQSRFYRSPEVLLGLDYDGAIDMWSLGCICAEMFLGLPLFPGTSDHDQVLRVIEMLGDPPEWMVEQGREGRRFFKETGGRPISPTTLEMDMLGTLAQDGTPEPSFTSKFKIKSPEEFSQATNTELKPRKKWFKFEKLTDIMESYPFRQGLSTQELDHAKEARRIFIHFVQGMLQIDPWKRWTALQALSHPFITGKRIPIGAEVMLDMPYDPKVDVRKNRQWERKQGAQFQSHTPTPSDAPSLPSMDRSLSFTQLNQMYGAMQVTTESETNPISPGSASGLSQGGFSLGTILNHSSSLGTSLNQSSFLAGSMHDPRDQFTHGPGHHSRPFGGQEPMGLGVPGSSSHFLFVNRSDPPHTSPTYPRQMVAGHKHSPNLSDPTGMFQGAQGLRRSRDLSDSMPGMPSDPEGWPMAAEDQKEKKAAFFTFDDTYDQRSGLHKANSFGGYGAEATNMGLAGGVASAGALSFDMPVRDFAIGNNDSKGGAFGRRRGRNSSFTDSRSLTNALSPQHRNRTTSATQFPAHTRGPFQNMLDLSGGGGGGHPAFQSSYDAHLVPSHPHPHAHPQQLVPPTLPTHLPPSLPTAGNQRSRPAGGEMPVAAWDPYFEEAFGDNLVEMEFSNEDPSPRR